MLTIEIERKFLVVHLPERIERCKYVEVLQGYLAADADGGEVRVRKVSEEHYLTVKRGRGLVRKECQIALTASQFEVLWPLTEGRRIEKTRIYIPFGELTIELDIYFGTIEGLVTVEVEFESLEQSRAFEPPPWFGREITSEERYKNRNLANLGLPAQAI